jgi:FtsP/CotA-like multicopper oxidase with cupredoxin domain
VSNAIVQREITLDLHNESPFPGLPFLHTNGPAALLNMSFFDDPITERPRAGTTEIWSFINLTSVPHPMHIHLIDFRVVNRTRFGGSSSGNNRTNPPTMVTSYINDRAHGVLQPFAHYLAPTNQSLARTRPVPKTWFMQPPLLSHESL